MKGYSEQGKKIPWATTLGGTYKHAEAHGNKEPFELPASWLERKDRMKLDTPFNFVCTADIIGGNSGSPVVNRTARSSASSSTATSSRWCSTSSTPTSKPEPWRSTRPASSKRCGLSTTPMRY